MGIQDRDYMKRRPGGESSGDRSAEGNLDRIAANLLGKHRRWIWGVILALGALILIGLIAGLL